MFVSRESSRCVPLFKGDHQLSYRMKVYKGGSKVLFSMRLDVLVSGRLRRLNRRPEPLLLSGLFPVKNCLPGELMAKKKQPEPLSILKIFGSSLRISKKIPKFAGSRGIYSRIFQSLIRDFLEIRCTKSSKCPN